MSTQGVFAENKVGLGSALWRMTWERIGPIVPNLKNELFGEFEVSETEAEKLASVPESLQQVNPQQILNHSTNINPTVSVTSDTPINTEPQPPSDFQSNTVKTTDTEPAAMSTVPDSPRPKDISILDKV